MPIRGSDARLQSVATTYMFSVVNSYCAFQLGLWWCSSWRPGAWYLPCSTEASVASRSGTGQIPTAGNWVRAGTTFPFESLIIALLCSLTCLSCTGKKLRPALLRKGCLAARASSCNPRTTLSQSEAQPEPRTPCAPNSNRCQSGGYHRQLVFVRLS